MVSRDLLYEPRMGPVRLARIGLSSAVLSMNRRNTQLEPTLYRKQKLKQLARVRPAGTLPWLFLRRAQPSSWFSRGSIFESMHWMELPRPVELARLIGT